MKIVGVEGLTNEQVNEEIGRGGRARAVANPSACPVWRRLKYRYMPSPRLRRSNSPAFFRRIPEYKSGV